MDVRQENEMKKQYLRQYSACLQRIKLLEEEIRVLRADKMYPGLLQEHMPGGGGGSDLSTYAARLDMAISRLEGEYGKRMEIFKDIKKRIGRLDNENQRAVLTYRYLLGWKWGRIAEQMNYSYQGVLKIHGRALLNFELKK